MSLEVILGGLGVVGVLAYALLGGADFGGGVLDALARGPRKAAQRRAIAHAMGPVWEANHVWLIFVIVIMFAAFPQAYAVLSVALFIPFHLVLLGIILRGSAFVFRSYSPEGARDMMAPREVRWGAVFGIASVITPVLLGMCLGAVSSGGIRATGEGPTTGALMPAGAAWLTPLGMGMGILALALCAYLAAVYVANETKDELCEDFRVRALLAATFVVVLSAVMLPVVASEAPHLWRGMLAPRTLPVLALGAVAAVVAGIALLRRRMRLARAAAVVQAGCVVAGWALAQYPYIIYPDVTVLNAAAPRSTLEVILYTLPVGLAILVPSLWALFKVFKGENLALLD